MMNSKAIASRLLQAIGTRNLDDLVSLFADKVDWYIPGNADLAPWLGRRGSKEEVKEFFQLLWAVTEAVDARIDQVIAEDDQCVIAGEFSTKMLQTNKLVQSLFYIHFTVSDDHIVRYRLLEDTLSVAVALGG
jgi:ketosteroid isomerase-like protein